MEEARQYPPLTPARWLYGVLLFGGTLVLFVGLVLQLIIGGNSINIAALIFVPTRVGMSLMRAFFPRTIPGDPPDRRVEIMWLAMWVGILVVTLKIALK